MSLKPTVAKDDASAFSLAGTQFAPVPTWLLYSGVSDKALRLFLVLTQYVNLPHGAVPGRQGLAELLACSARSVSSAIEELKRARAIAVEPRAGEPNRYRVVFDHLSEEEYGSLLQGVLQRTARPPLQRTSTNSKDIIDLDIRTKDLVAAENSNEVSLLCDLLSEKIGGFRGNATRAPAVTPLWLKQMRLLIERGPKGNKVPERLKPEKVRAAINYTFESLAEPRGANGFCWAAQIQSPAGLREHYEQLRVARDVQVKAAQRDAASEEVPLNTYDYDRGQQMRDAGIA